MIYSIFTPDPRIETFEICKYLGLVGDDLDVAKFNHQSPENCFAAFIAHDRFRNLYRPIEKMVD